MKKIHISKPRSAALLALGWLHWAMLVAIIFAMFFDMLYGLAELELMSPQAAFFRGLLFAIPTGLSWFAIKRIRSFMLFLLASLGLSGLSWLLVGHPGGALIMFVMCLIRMRTRLAEGEEGAVRSLFDTPSLFGLCVFVLLFLFSAGVADGLPRLQWLTVLGAVLYLIVCLGYNGLDRLDSYLTLNKDMHGLPARRIQHIAGSAVLILVLLTAALLLPMALGHSGFVRLKMPEFKGGGTENLIPEATPVPGRPEMKIADMLPQVDSTPIQIPPIVGYIFFGLIGALLLAGLFAAVIHLFKNFRRSFSDSRDVVQYLSRDEQEYARELTETLRRPRIWDRSPGAVIRRRYRKALLKAGEPPERWMTPQEAENAVGVQIPALHRLYEKARYGREECTQEDLRELR